MSANTIHWIYDLSTDDVVPHYSTLGLTTPPDALEFRGSVTISGTTFGSPANFKRTIELSIGTDGYVGWWYLASASCTAKQSVPAKSPYEFDCSHSESVDILIEPGSPQDWDDNFPALLWNDSYGGGGDETFYWGSLGGDFGYVYYDGTPPPPPPPPSQVPEPLTGSLVLAGLGAGMLLRASRTRRASK